jgi:hypothetical protein
VWFSLQVDQTNRVTGAPRRRGNKFETERFEPKINLRVHQTAGMNGQEFHLFGTSIGDLLDPFKSIFPSRENLL